MLNTIEAIHHFACIALFGLIWTIQRVQYPSFLRIDPKQFSLFHAEHTRSITVVVAPLMIIEFTSSAYLLWKDFNYFTATFTATSILNFLATFLIFVPFHLKLPNDFDKEQIHKLIRLNWIRTTLWTMAALATFYHMLVKTR